MRSSWRPATTPCVAWPRQSRRHDTARRAAKSPASSCRLSVLHDDVRELRRHVARAFGDMDRHLARDRPVDLGDRARPARPRRSAVPAVGLLADRRCRAAGCRARRRRIPSHIRSPPPAPKICSTWPQFEQTCMLMFSTMPRIGMPTFSNILRPFLRVEQRDVLRRRDDHRAGHRHASATA